MNQHDAQTERIKNVAIEYRAAAETAETPEEAQHFAALADRNEGVVVERGGRPKRLVFFLDQSMTDADGNFVPSLVEEGQPGHTPTNYRWGTDWEVAKAARDESNRRLGIEPNEALLIIAESMRLGSVNRLG
jgi:hypothetical protein